MSEVLEEFKSFLRDSPSIPNVMSVLGERQTPSIPHICLVCNEETEKGRVDEDSVTKRIAWFCFDCFNTIHAVRKNLQGQ